MDRALIYWTTGITSNTKKTAQNITQNTCKISLMLFETIRIEILLVNLKNNTTASCSRKQRPDIICTNYYVRNPKF